MLDLPFLFAQQHFYSIEYLWEYLSEDISSVLYYLHDAFTGLFSYDGIRLVEQEVSETVQRDQDQYLTDYCVYCRLVAILFFLVLSGHFEKRTLFFLPAYSQVYKHKVSS